MKQIHHGLMKDFGEIHWSKSNELTGRIYRCACPPPPRQMGSEAQAGPWSEKPLFLSLSSQQRGQQEVGGGRAGLAISPQGW